MKEIISKSQKKELFEAMQDYLCDLKLTPEDSLFCLYFLETNHIGKAYKMAYGKGEFYPLQACTFYGTAKMKREDIKTAIEQLKKMQQYAYDVDPNKYLEFLLQVASADIGDYVKFGTEEVPVTNRDGNVIDEETGEVLKRKKSYLEFANSLGVDTKLISKIQNGKNGISIELHDKKWAWDRLRDFYEWKAKKEANTEEINTFIDALKGRVDVWKKDDKENGEG